MEMEQKLAVLGDAAKYDVSCSSSGSNRAEKRGGLGNTEACGICHTWTADGRCLSLLKVLLSNACVYDCAYCVNRVSAPKPRATFTPRELADLTIGFYRRNYIEGLFLSSGVIKNPDYTTENMIATLQILRGEYGFNGYVHAKIIPGADAALIDVLGRLADRLSCNIELPSSVSLGRLAPQKLPEHILTPMKTVRNTLRGLLEDGSGRRSEAPVFAPAGQTTQMIIGASPDTDYTILKLSKGLYGHYKLKRVYFSAFVPPAQWGQSGPTGGPNPNVPLLREHRLYQADWLMRFYGFDAEELLDERNQSLPEDVDPKCDWAVRHPEAFPVEVNTAPMEVLLRVPGIGPTSARRIVAARRQGRLRGEHLRKLGVVMKRAQFFLTADGKFSGMLTPGHPLLRRQLTDGRDIRQLSLFDSPEAPPLPPGVLNPSYMEFAAPVNLAELPMPLAGTLP